MEHVAEWEDLSTDNQFPDATFEIVEYGAHSRQSFELFRNKLDTQSNGTAVFIHGGFWRAMDREQSRFVARPFLENSYDCIIAEYRLMPEFSLGDLVDDAADMLLKINELQASHGLSKDLILSGHSAGAHLAAFGLNQAVRKGFNYGTCGLIYFSGVFDIYPVSTTSIGAELKMSKQDIERWSVYAGNANNNIQPLFVVGNDETDDFKRQSILAAQQLGDPNEEHIYFVANANHLSLMTKFAREPELAGRILRQVPTI